MHNWIQEVVSTLGYLGIAALMFVENVFPPIPSELIMPLAGFTAARGDLSFLWIVVAGVVGSVVGQLPLYYLGRVVGEERVKQWADEYGRWLMVSRDDIDRAQSWFDQHGKKAVLFARMVPGIRSLISIPAGICGMSLAPFLLYSLIGMSVWVLFLAYLGRLLSENYRQVEQFLGPISYVVLGGLVLAAVVWVWRRKNQEEDPKEQVAD